MSKLNVVIFEDNIEEAQYIKEMLIFNDCNVIAVISNYVDAIQIIEQNEVDLVLIDIFIDSMPFGMNIAQYLANKRESIVPFIFITHSSDRTIFEMVKTTNPISYLTKPFNELDLLYAIELSIKKFHTNQLDDYTFSGNKFFIKKSKALYKVEYRDIIYIEVESRYCEIFTSKEKFVVQLSLSKILEMLPSDKFVQTHRSTIVNTDKIVSIVISENLIYLESNHTATLGNAYKGFMSNYLVI